jgi:hypothetical protein
MIWIFLWKMWSQARDIAILEAAFIKISLTKEFIKI